VSAIGDVGTPNDADLSKFYEAHPDLFRAPEYRSFAVASLAPAALEQPGEIPLDRLRKEYDQRKDEFETPEQRNIQQILSPSEDKAKEAEAALAAGKDWKEVATTIAGQDPDTIDLGLLNRQEIPHELGDVAFELPLNQASPPIKTPLGWHILRVVKIEPATTKSFEEAKAQIEAGLKLEEVVDRLDKIANQADDALASGAALVDVAAKFGLKMLDVAAADEAGRDPDGKPVALPAASEEILKTVFATQQGDTSRITDAKDNSIFAVHVAKVTPPQVKPLAEVKNVAVAGWQAERKREAAAKEAAALATAVTPDLGLAKVAGDKKLTLLPAVSLSRSEAPGSTTPAALVAKLFAAKPGEVITISDATGAYTAQLKEIQSPETVPEAAAARLADQLTGEARGDIAGEFTEALRRRFPVEIQRAALDRMF
jgi:peptidyl-prolyl cis-trans isomerase D